MRLHRFFTTEHLTEGKMLTLHDESLSHQLRTVFRFGVGDEIILFNDSGFEYVSSLAKIVSDRVDVFVREKRATCFTPQKKVHIGFSILKKDNTDWVFEKCTEIGVTCFTPLVSERTEKKNIDMIRARKIVVEASEQSGRCFVPCINEVTSLTNFLKERTVPLFALDSRGESICAEMRSCGDVCVLIGPEGGWSEKELTQMKESGVRIVSLGAQTLRAETASVAVSALLLL